MYVTICYKADVNTNVRIYAIKYKLFIVSYHSFNMPDVLWEEAWSSCSHEVMLNII